MKMKATPARNTERGTGLVITGEPCIDPATLVLTEVHSDPVKEPPPPLLPAERILSFQFLGRPMTRNFLRSSSAVTVSTQASTSHARTPKQTVR
mmetsp:Transcript_63317/g.125213  ORF Transcript_63317/g.125213 Transcript_63317/m.125213 type:complete len:94 (-) Transcript_63317:502-783(-)